ncbi:hypothetical protein [Streptomyces chartreusis]|uniref:hypothetical protein n=1 Tax=Streptomyces chartreusis TaxID=1969 RepID=UPI00362F8565
MSDYDHMTNADVMSADELAEYDRDAEFRLDAEDEARALQAEAEEAARVAEAGDDLDDCGAVDPNDMCGICDGCRESTAEDIEAQHESGSLTYAEAVQAHELNGTWG